jgi:hypothetical protein
MKFTTAVIALPAVSARSLRKMKSDPDSLFTLSLLSPPPAPLTNAFFTVAEEDPELTQSSFTMSEKNNGDSELALQ